MWAEYCFDNGIERNKKRSENGTHFPVRMKRRDIGTEITLCIKHEFPFLIQDSEYDSRL